MPEPLVKADDAGRTYGTGERAVVALEGATFEIPAGSRIALVGSSGSGKTTLLHLVTGLDLPTSGTIQWPALGTREQLRPRLVAMAFQGQTLIPPLTVVENVALPLLIAGDPESEALKTAWEMLARLSVADIGKSLPEEISGGQSQRVAIARALVTHPTLLLVDEPTGQQDSVGSRHLMQALLHYAEEAQATLVVATHDKVVADFLPTRWTIQHGHLETR
jgi:putative ABC transport system ATP-binding protein/lipoprotein-releasing system ATP-binding protein